VKSPEIISFLMIEAESSIDIDTKWGSRIAQNLLVATG
jgi:hypothetical protein